MEQELKIYDLTVFSDYQSYLLKNIKAKTGQLIAAGFTFDGEQFPADSSSNFNYQVLDTKKSKFTFPKNIAKLDGTSYSLTSANVSLLWDAAKDFIEPILDGNRTLVNSVLVATTIAELDLIVDNR